MEELSLQDIENMDDVWELDEFGRKHDIPLEGCQSIEDFKERIMLHQQKLNGHHDQLLDHRRYENLREENIEKREALCKIYQAVLKKQDGPMNIVEQILNTQKLNANLTALQNEECNVVIAGQTGAGKSTLLNLLLGMDLLPKHILSCTSSICKIRYGKRFMVRVKGSEEMHEETLNSAEQTNNYLEQHVTEKCAFQRSEGKTTPEVEIFAPADILRCGVTIIDTPGFGEYEAFDNLVKDFVTSAHVAAFIYVIKTDSAGGVQEDRLVRFLKTFLENRDQFDHSFNPRAALFVCNRWDQIDDSEKPIVKKNVFEKLRDVWPSLHDNQVCFFSTTRAQASLSVDKEYITKELHHLLVSLNSLFVLAHQDAIKKSYGWLKSVMSKCSVNLQTILSRSAMTDREHEEAMQMTYKQLKHLDSQAKVTLEQLKRELETLQSFMARTYHDILSCKHFKKHLLDWNDETLPLVSEDVSTKDLKLILVDAVVNKMFSRLENNARWVLVGSLCSDMQQNVQKKLQSLDNDMADISTNFRRGSIYSTTSSESSDSEDEIRVERDVMFKQEARDFASHVIDNKLVISYREKSKLVMDKLTKKILKRLKANTHLHTSFVARFTEGFRDEIDTVSANIPEFIKTKQALINDIMIYRLECRGFRDRNRVKLAMEDLEHLKQLVRGFGDACIKDVTSDLVFCNMAEPTLGMSCIRVIPGGQGVSLGLWAQLHTGEMNVNEINVPIMVRSYTCQRDDQYIFKEIVKMRCLMHDSVANFRGMSRVDNQSAFIFDGHLESARNYLKHSHSKKKLFSLLTGLLDGLVAIHEEGLVHNELTLDTLMVNSKGKVKLCYMCLPRKCKLPTDIDVIDAADFTCFSPKVLRGAVYNRETDMYGFGLLVYEVLLRRKPFAQQSDWKLSRFVEEVDPESMLDLKGNIPQPLSDILHGCLLPGTGPVIHVARIKEKIRCSMDDHNVLIKVDNHPKTFLSTEISPYSRELQMLNQFLTYDLGSDC